MAQPMKKESQPVGHALIGETLDTPILQCDLFEEIQSLHKEDAWLQGTGPSSKTLVKHSDLRIVLLAMRKKMSMHEHKTAARISVQTLAGQIDRNRHRRAVRMGMNAHANGGLLLVPLKVPNFRDYAFKIEGRGQKDAAYADDVYDDHHAAE